MPLSVGDKLGPYEIVAPLGAGGMGEVYRARDTKLDREVAIKVMPAALARDPERLARFEREAKVLASLNHPNIAQIYGVEESSGVRALVMELVSGAPLKGPLTLETSLNYARQIADALEAAHDKGIIHRDLKPANIMVTPEGVVKVLDFGLAAVAQPPSSSSTPENSPTMTMAATQAGMIMGTAAYMSPEQAAGKPVDKRADIWSYGVVLWEMLSGQRLFDGETVSHTLADVLRAPIDFDKLPATTPRVIRDLVKRCLDRDVKSRLRDIGEARVAIQKYLANPGSAEASRPAVPARSPSRLDSLGRVASWAIAGIAVVALAALGYRHANEEAPRLVKLTFELPPKSRFVQASVPAVSPDGRRVVFTINEEGKQELWVRDLDSLTTRMLPGAEQGTQPFWSPDSRFVGFFANGKLKKVDVAGGPALTLCDTANGRGGTWNQDDVIVFAPTTTSGLMRVSAAGGVPAPVIQLDKSTTAGSLRWPWFLPDGRHFLYTAQSGSIDGNAVYVGDLKSKESKLVLPVASNAVYVPSGQVLFVRERTLMAQPFDAEKLQTVGNAAPIAEQVDYVAGGLSGQFTASRNGVLAFTSGGASGNSQVTWFDRSGKPLGAVGKPADIFWASLSPDGKTVATDRLDGQVGSRDIWLHDLVRGTEQRLTFTGLSQFPIWSPDGERVAFEAERDGVRKMLAKAANGSGPEEVLNPTRMRPESWSRDGRYLVGATIGQDIFVHPQFGDKKPFGYVATEFAESMGRISPDGRWLAYQSNESKRYEIYVVGFPTQGGKWQISTGGGTGPVWSRDGRELFFISADNKMMAVEIKAGAKFDVGIPKPLFDLRLATGNSNFDVSADGRFLIPVAAEQSVSPPMTVVLNWQAMLKKN